MQKENMCLKKISPKISFLFLLNLVLCLSFQQPLKAQSVKRKVTEKIIFRMDSLEVFNNSFTYSNNLRRVACRIKINNKQLVAVNGINGRGFDSVCVPVFNNDGSHYAYAAREGLKWFIMVDEKEFVVLNTDTSVVALLFATNEKVPVYVINSHQQYFAVVNNKISEPYDFINANTFSFSADGYKVAYVAQKGNKSTIVFDGKENYLFDRVGFPVISADGKHIIYSAFDSGKSIVVLDTIKSQHYESTASTIFGDASGLHCAYVVDSNKNQFVFVNGIKAGAYGLVHTLCYNSNGSRLVYGIDASPGNSGFNQFAIVDGKKEGPFETVVEGSFVFSPDGKHLAYEVEKHDEFMLVVDGKEGKHYSDIMQSSTIFSPNNLKVAFVAENDSKRMAILNEMEGPAYDDILSLAFSPDSKWLAYSARLGNKNFVIVTNSKGTVYDSFMGQGEIVFDSPFKFHYIAIRDKVIYLIEEEIEK
jgi:WD40 repeat protein